MKWMDDLLPDEHSLETEEKQEIPVLWHDLMCDSLSG